MAQARRLTAADAHARNKSMAQARRLTAADVPDAHARLRATFARGDTRPLAWRVAQLTRFGRMMKEGLPKLQRALWRDLHKNPGEALMAELGNVMHDVKYALQHLESWMAPETVETGRVNRGAVSQIYHDPLGVVLVIGACTF